MFARGLKVGMNVGIMFFLSVIFFAPQVIAATCTSTGDGDWTAGGTWSCGRAPQGGDIIIVQSGHTVDVNGNLSIAGSPVRLEVRGILDYGNSGKLNLPAGSGVILYSPSQMLTGTGVGNNNRLQINSVTVWNAADGDVVCPSNCPTYGNGNVLPIKLVYFKSVTDKAGVVLRWATASEQDNSHFTVERSSDGSTYKAIAEIRGVGNSSNRVEYSYTDSEKTTGKVYYRLLQTDYNGSSTYSHPIVTHHDLHETLAVSFASDGSLHVIAAAEHPDEVYVTYTDALGKVVEEAVLNMHQKTEETFHLSRTLHQGVYMVQIRSGSETATQRIFVSHSN